MRKTHKDLLDWLGLKVGDVIRFNDSPNKWIVANEEYIALDPKVDRYIYGNGAKLVDELPTESLIEMEFNILPKPERVGDLECSGNCKNCPLMSVCSWDSDYQGKKIYEVLDYELTTIHDDQEIYDLLKARLDKEVKEIDDKM